MANPKHLEILKQGVEIWNQWRINNPDVKPSLNNTIFENFSFAHYDLRYSDLSYCKFINCNFGSTDFLLANFSNSILTGADLCAKSLDGALFINAEMSNSNLEDVDITQADFTGTKLSNSCFFNARLWETQFCQADLTNCDFHSANLENADLTLANLQGADFRDVNLNGACLIETNLTNCNLQKTDLRWTYLTKSNLTGAKLYGSARLSWKINNVECDYIYFDEEAKKRIPQNRNFESGEFERLYRSVPTVEMVFENGMNPIVDPPVLAFIAQQIKTERPELGVELHSIDIKGIYPQAIFGISREKHQEEVGKLLIEKYEGIIAAFREDKDRSREIIDRLLELLKIEKTSENRGQSRQISVNAGGRYIEMSSQAQYNETRIEIQFQQAVEKIRQALEDTPDETLSKKTRKKILEYLDQAPKTLVGEAAKAGVKKLYEFLSSQNIASIIPKVLPYMDDIKKVFDSLV